MILYGPSGRPEKEDMDMPYIAREERPRLEPEIRALIEKLKAAPAEQMDGQVNYVISRLLAGLYPPRYFNYNRAMGVLSCVTQEFYRRSVAPYEDGKIREHGDIV